MNARDDIVMRALGRIVRTWSLIRLIPTQELLPLQPSLLNLLSKRSDLTEDEMVALGLKHLYSTRNEPLDVKGGLFSTSGITTLLRKSPQKADDNIFERRPKRPDGHTVTAAGERTSVSVKRKTVEEAIEAAEGYRRLGVTTISIEAPDGKTYSLDEFNALHRRPP